MLEYRAIILDKLLKVGIAGYGVVGKKRRELIDTHESKTRSLKFMGNQFRIEDKEFLRRFNEYIVSTVFNDTPSYSKSEYWKYHSFVAQAHVVGNTVFLSGESGYYVPSRKGLHGLYRKVLNALKNPALSFRKIRAKVFQKIKLMNYFDAFDTVMNQDPLTEISLNSFVDKDLSPERVDCAKLESHVGVLTSVAEIHKDYFLKDKYALSPSMVEAYYYRNILNAYTTLGTVKVILEIGAGNGNLASILMKYIPGVKLIIVDLPETLCFSINFLKHVFDEASILLPHEIIENIDLRKHDIIFLTPAQLHYIPSGIVDLAINTSSFQEMTTQQIDEYFSLIQRCCVNGGYFFTSNRVEKISTNSECPVRFSDYPWNHNNQVVIYEISRFIRLVQLDAVFIRLEKIVN